MSVYAHLTTNRASAPRLLIACSFAAMGLAIYLTDLAEQRINADDHAWRSALLCTDALTVLAIWSERRATGKFEGFYGWVEQNAVRREALGICSVENSEPALIADWTLAPNSPDDGLQILANIGDVALLGIPEHATAVDGNTQRTGDDWALLDIRTRTIEPLNIRSRISDVGAPDISRVSLLDPTGTVLVFCGPWTSGQCWLLRPDGELSQLTTGQIMTQSWALVGDEPGEFWIRTGHESGGGCTAFRLDGASREVPASDLRDPPERTWVKGTALESTPDGFVVPGNNRQSNRRLRLDPLSL